MKFVIILGNIKNMEGIYMKKLNLKHKEIILYILTLIIVIGGDQITKILIDQTMQLYSGYEIIPDFFYFTYSHNAGAAWGIFQGKTYLFVICALIAAVGMVYYFMQSEPNQKFMRFGLVLLFGGMIGNLIDRIVFGYVRDFIDFIILGYDFPIFNIADMGITIGMFFILLEVGIEEYKTWKLSKSLD